MPSSARGSAARRAWRSRSGVAAAEFAMIAGLLLMLVIGIMEVSRYLMTIEALRTVTADAVRLVVLRGSANLNASRNACNGMSGSLSGAGARTGALQASLLSVSLGGCSTDSGVTQVTVTVSYPFSHAVPLLPAARTELRETAVAIFN